ncbi:retron St85 family RNA-directed DNA polymerase, partial [Acinetobacter baumannii]
MKNLNILKSLEEKFSIPQHELQEFIKSSPRKYKVYQIPKRSSGTRTIAQPTAELKEYQRHLV